jgi:hypothetical protein
MIPIRHSPQWPAIPSQATIGHSQIRRQSGRGPKQSRYDFSPMVFIQLVDG